MPNWKYKEPKEFPIDRTPERGYFLMKHRHMVASNRMVAKHGIVLPNWPQEHEVKLILTHSDMKDFDDNGKIEKEFKCPDCFEVETYRFHMRRPGEERQVEVRDVLLEERKDA